MLKYERRSRRDMSFHEDEVKLAKTMMDKLRTMVEYFYYFMEYRGVESFTMILLSADNIKLDKLLKKGKRSTDILVEIDKEKNLYMLFCQATNSEGGKQYAEIIMSNITMHSGDNIYCVVSELKTIKYTIQEVLFKMVEKYITIKQDKRVNHVFFTMFDDIIGDVEYED